MKKRALISVTDKSGIDLVAERLNKLNYEIVSTGGTAKVIKDSGVPVTYVSDITGFPECLDGRVKTLHPKIHAGILAIRDNKEHVEQLEELGINQVDIVIINLYPFKKTIQKENVALDEAVENIDIGGPTLLRSAAKNYQDVIVIIDPNDYDRVLKELETSGDLSNDLRFDLACKVFEHTAHYDALIAAYFREKIGKGLPDLLTLTYEKAEDMRYGENPHQDAIFYKEPVVKKGMGGLASAKQLHGKKLSFNNINDTNGALDLLREFDEISVVACKHANPCGVGSSTNIYDAYMRAYNADPVSIFGGIVVANSEIDEKTAEEINKIFVEIVVAPSYSIQALEILKKKKNLRVLVLEEIGLDNSANNDDIDLKKVTGGLLVQQKDMVLLPDDFELEVATDRKPTDKEYEDLLFAWKIVKHTKSNAIVVAKDKRSTGVGPGQANRIWAAESAINRSGDDAEGAVMASDAFFPFNDVVKAAAEAGIKAIIQPGGSIRDQESIDECNKHNIAMVFTKMRHFKH